MKKIKELIKKAKYCKTILTEKTHGCDLKRKFFERLPESNLCYQSVETNCIWELEGEELINYLNDDNNWSSYQGDAYCILNIHDNHFDLSFEITHQEKEIYHRFKKYILLLNFEKLDFKYLSLFDVDIDRSFNYKSLCKMEDIIEEEKEKAFQDRLLKLRSEILKQND